ncbi:MAG TPA: class I SAM-dependent methyltransferase [Candidatus Dependentiae bacterium]|nr:class I SAM-dependent methyltransferase [Candidatus Dependentiae bacterium]
MSDNYFSKLTKGLTLIDGIWFSKEPHNVYYPKEGNRIFFEIEDTSFWYRHRNNCIIAAATNYLKPDNPIVEIGSGNGFVAQGLINSGFDVILIEPDPTGIINSKNRGLKKLICSSFDNLTVEENSLENVVLFDVLEHIADDSLILSKVYKSMKNDAIMMITVPAYNFLWSDEDEHDGHFRRYELTKLCRKLKRIGFAVQYTTYFFSLLPMAIILFRTIPSILNLKRQYTVRTYQRENRLSTDLFFSLLTKIFAMELKLVKSERKILFGSSILLVAKK